MNIFVFVHVYYYYYLFIFLSRYKFKFKESNLLYNEMPDSTRPLFTSNNFPVMMDFVI